MAPNCSYNRHCERHGGHRGYCCSAHAKGSGIINKWHCITLFSNIWPSNCHYGHWNLAERYVKRRVLPRIQGIRFGHHCCSLRFAIAGHRLQWDYQFD